MKKAFVQLHIAVFLAGFTGLFGELIHLNEAWLVWYRLLITSVTMWVLFYFTKKLLKVGKADKWKLTGIGLLSALHWVTFYGSIKYANVSVALVCFAAVGFFTAFLEPLLLRRPIKLTEVFLGLLVMAGIAVIFNFETAYKTGIILGIISAFLISIAMILLREYVNKYNPETALTYQLTGGLITLSLLMPLYEYYLPSANWWPSLSDWGWLLVLAWICSVVAFQFTAYAMKKLSAFTVNLTFNLEPVYGILLAFIFFKENKFLGKWFFVGLGLIMISLIIHIVMLIRSNKKTAAAHD